MSLYTLMFVLAFLLGAAFTSCHQLSGDAACSAFYAGEALPLEAEQWCLVGALDDCRNITLQGNVLLSGSEPGNVLDEDEVSELAFGAGANLLAQCFALSWTNASQAPVDLETLFKLPFLTWQGERGSLTVRDVELRLPCDALHLYQEFLCGVRVPGDTRIFGSSITIVNWQNGNSTLERVNLTCDPGSDVYVSACTMAPADGVDDVLRVAKEFQDSETPLVLTLTHGINFGASYWPKDGLRITSNVTLMAVANATAVIDFGLRSPIFIVDSRTSATAFLTFRGVVLLNLPLSYLPLEHPRRPFGVLSTGLWPVYREQVSMGLFNCTLILTEDEFKFWSYWLSILVSPVPSVRQLGNWSFASGVDVQPSGEDYILLTSYHGRYTTFMDVRYEITNSEYNTQQRYNILQITGDAHVPPTVVYQIRDSDDLITAVAAVGASAGQFGNYIIQTANITLHNRTSDDAHVAIVYPATITTWPQTYAILDLQLLQNVFDTRAIVSIRNTVLVNLAPLEPLVDRFSALTSGMWIFNCSTWRNTDQQWLQLDNAALVVQQQEVDFYLAITVEWDGKLDNEWVTSYKLQSYDKKGRHWIFFSRLQTLRFAGQNINITSSVPQAYDMIPITLPAIGDNTGSSKSGTSRKEIIMFTLLAVTLPTALAVAAVTLLWAKRRRMAQLCQKPEALGPDGKTAGLAGGSGRGSHYTKEEPACCFKLAFPLRKSKYVNPLYADPELPAPEVLLTEVLGPICHAHSLQRRRDGAHGPVMPILVDEAAAALTTGALTATEPSMSPGVQGNDQFGSGGVGAELVALGLASERPSALPSSGASVRSNTLLTSRALSCGQPQPASLPPSGEIGLEDRVGGTSQHSSWAWRKPGSFRSVTASGSTGGLGATPGATVMRTSAAGGSRGGTGHSRLCSGSSSVLTTSDPRSAANSEQACPAIEGIRNPGADGMHGAIEGEAGPMAAGAAALQVAGVRALTPPQELARLDKLRAEIGDRHLEVHHSLGWGGCGVVYKGTWKGLPVAVKTVLLQGDGRQSRQFLTEAAISTSLQHANIVTTYLYELRPLDEVDQGLGSTMEIHVEDFIEEGGGARMTCWKLYIVQEFCELGTLKTAIDQGHFKGMRGMPNMVLLLATAVDMAGGLAHVHSKDVVHGDITVSNVLLQAFPGRPHGCIAKLADFGLSVKFDAEQSHVSDMYGGTPHYMAPERAQGRLGKPADVFSLGVCLWELYCGTPPWRQNAMPNRGGRYDPGSLDSDGGSNGSSETLYPYNDGGRQNGGPAVRYGPGGADVFRFPRGCPPDFSDLVLSCLAPDPAQRPTAPAVLEALRQIQQRFW